MRALSLIFAFVTLACAFDALVLPALAQQLTPNQPLITQATPQHPPQKQRPPGDCVEDTGRTASPSYDAPANQSPDTCSIEGSGDGGGVASVGATYTMFLPDRTPVRASAAAKFGEAGRAKAKDGETIPAPVRIEQRRVTPNDFRIAPQPPASDDDEEEDDDDDPQ